MKENMWFQIRIDGKEGRDKLIAILVHNGYTVKLREENEGTYTEYWVVVLR